MSAADRDRGGLTYSWIKEKFTLSKKARTDEDTWDERQHALGVTQMRREQAASEVRSVTAEERLQAVLMDEAVLGQKRQAKASFWKNQSVPDMWDCFDTFMPYISKFAKPCLISQQPMSMIDVGERRPFIFSAHYGKFLSLTRAATFSGDEFKQPGHRFAGTRTLNVKAFVTRKRVQTKSGKKSKNKSKPKTTVHGKDLVVVSSATTVDCTSMMTGRKHKKPLKATVVESIIGLRDALLKPRFVRTDEEGKALDSMYFEEVEGGRKFPLSGGFCERCNAKHVGCLACHLKPEDRHLVDLFFLRRCRKGRVTAADTEAKRRRDVDAMAVGLLPLECS